MSYFATKNLLLRQWLSRAENAEEVRRVISEGHEHECDNCGFVFVCTDPETCLEFSVAKCHALGLDLCGDCVRLGNEEAEYRERTGDSTFA